MTEPRVFFTLNLMAGFGVGDTRERCPLCGSEDPVTVLVDPDDWSTDPVQMMCAVAHSWLSATMEAWHLASIVLYGRADHPEFMENARRLAELQARDQGDMR